MERKVSRRDFLRGVAVTIGGMAVAAPIHLLFEGREKLIPGSTDSLDDHFVVRFDNSDDAFTKEIEEIWPLARSLIEKSGVRKYVDNVFISNDKGKHAGEAWPEEYKPQSLTFDVNSWRERVEVGGIRAGERLVGHELWHIIDLAQSGYVRRSLPEQEALRFLLEREKLLTTYFEVAKADPDIYWNPYQPSKAPDRELDNDPFHVSEEEKAEIVAGSENEMMADMFGYFVTKETPSRVPSELWGQFQAFFTSYLSSLFTR